MKKASLGQGMSRVPHTDPKAVIIGWSNVSNALAITVTRATLREAKIVASTFELADVPNPFRIVKGRLTVEVKCSWYGERARTTGTQRLTITNSYKLDRNYSGEIVTNIGRKEEKEAAK